MSRHFFFCVIALTILLVIARTFQAAFMFALGTRIADLYSIGIWLIFLGILTLLWEMSLLNYCHFKQYRITFLVLALKTFFSLLYMSSLYKLTVTRDVTPAFLIIGAIVLTTEVAYAATLIFSKAGKNVWLKTAGNYLLALGVVTIIATALGITSLSYRVNWAARSEAWLSLLSALGPMLFAKNFLDEKRAVAGFSDSGSIADSIVAYSLMASLFGSVVFIPTVTLQAIALKAHPLYSAETAGSIIKLFDAKNYVNRSGDTLRYRLLIPEAYDSSRSYPIVVCLHGKSGCGTDNVRQVASAMPAIIFALDSNRSRYPAFIFVPQCPEGFTWGGIPYTKPIDKLVLETLTALEQEFSIDTARRYVTGNSIGGYGTWHFICTYPQKFAAAIPLSGGGNPALAKRIVDIPIWAFHGAKDFIVPVNGTRDMIKAVRTAGGNPCYTEFPEAKHNIGEDLQKTSGLVKWLFTQKKK